LSFDKMRKDRLRWVVDYVGSRRSVPFDELVGNICFEFGVRRKVAVEYIYTLEDARKVRVKGVGSNKVVEVVR